MSKRLQNIVRWLTAQDWNRPGADKTRVVLAIEEYVNFRKAVAKAKRVRE